MRRDTEGQFLTGTMILGFLSIFKKSQAPSPFEALNSTRLSKFEKDLRPHVQMKGRSRAFSMVSPLIWTGGLKSLSHFDRRAEFNASKGDGA